MTKKNKTSRYRKYRDGLWLRSRYVLYVWWFKFLRLAEVEKLDVDWSKYRGWGGRDAVLNQRFETWWETHWRQLFAVANEGDTAKYEIANRKVRAEAIRVAYLVYTHRHAGTLEDVYVLLQKRYKRGLLSLDPSKVLETKRVNQHMKRYMAEAERLLGEVCQGRFG
jgi:hypothetical protein